MQDFCSYFRHTKMALVFDRRKKMASPRARQATGKIRNAQGTLCKHQYQTECIETYGVSRNSKHASTAHDPFSVPQAEKKIP